MTVETLLEEGLKLKPVEQMRVVETIMEHLSSSDKVIDELWNKEAARRLKLYETGEMGAVTVEELFKGVI